MGRPRSRRSPPWSDGKEELYDHDTDPGEWHNVAELPANASALATLQKQLAARR